MLAVMLMFCGATVLASNVSFQPPSADEYHVGIMPRCGDGFISPDQGETCDPPGEPAYPDGPDCRDDCTYCGDGVLDEGEACDDGNNVAGDGCAPDCTMCAGEIGDFVWNDGVVGVDCDGIQPVDSANGLNGHYVRLYEEPSGDLLQEVMTHNFGGIDGYYLFVGLCAGDYRVEVDTPAGMIVAPAMVGDPATDSNGSPAAVSLPADDSSDITIDFGFCTEVVDEGCTPGYWKNHLFAWGMTAYTPETLVGAVFDLPTDFASVGSSTLLEALRFHGGPDPIDAARNLIKHATAALLNATHPDVDYMRAAADIIDDVNAAMATGDSHEMNTLKSALDDDNNSGCPLNGRAPRVDRQVERDHASKSRADRALHRRKAESATDLQLN
jgi:cysteine-rich repeat protein